MIDITSKNPTLRTAIAVSHVTTRYETIAMIENGEVPKGDVLSISRSAGIMAAKNTSAVLPLCHPLSVEYTDIDLELKPSEGTIKITCTVSGVAKTGFEMEALNGAMTAALNAYDMLKPVNNSLSIEKTYLQEKKGGKSDFKDRVPQDFKASVIVCSDSISAGMKKDKAGQIISEKLSKQGIPTETYEIIPDDPEQIQEKVGKSLSLNHQLIILTGGTGLSPRDVTPESVRPMLDREVPGIMEAARQYGMERTPYAMLSRGIAGVCGNALILTLPGSSRGAAETMDALFPSVLHIYPMMAMAEHS